MDRREVWEKVNVMRGWDRLNTLPQKFESLTADQERVVGEVLEGFERLEGVEDFVTGEGRQHRSPRIVCLDAPTGSGKSVVGESVRRLMEVRGLYVCSSKGLQDQLAREFSDKGRVLKGRTNYLTVPQWDGVNCGDCTKVKGEDDSCNWCKSVSECPYEVAKGDAIRSELAIINSAYWVAESNHVGRMMMGRGLVVFDEADTLESVVLRSVEVFISKYRTQKYGLPKQPKVLESKYSDVTEQSWREYLAEVEGKLAKVLEQGADKDLRSIRERKGIVNLLGKLSQVNIDNWVCESNDRGVSFRPVILGGMGKELIWKWLGGVNVLMMSATFVNTDVTLNGLGWDGAWEDVTMKSTFPAKNRPVNVKGRIKVGRDGETRERVAEAVATICAKYIGERILVHSVSFDFTKTIVECLRSQDDGREIYRYTSAADREGIVEQWQDSSTGVCVAPSLDRGLDLPDDKCRVVIIAKVPYPYLGDKAVSKRAYGYGQMGRLWYVMETVRTVLQMSGRAMRHKEDSCEIWIVDAAFRKLYRENNNMFPGWWKESVRFV